MNAPDCHYTFLIPVYNAETTIENTLNSVVNQSLKQPYQIIIIDDDSTDQSLNKIEEWKKNHVPQHCFFSIMRLDHSGEAAAMNAGIAQAQGRFIIWLESDVILDGDWLRHLIGEFEDEQCAGAGGLLLPVETDPWLAKILGYEIAFKMNFDGDQVKHITSANAVYRKEVFNQLGQCEEYLGASSFDSEYNHRIREHGWVLKRNSNAVAWHHYKTRITDCLRRTFWYGFRRPHVKTQVLYKADRWVGFLVLLSMVFPMALVYSLFDPFWGIIILSGVLLAHFIYGWVIYANFRYAPLLLAGPVFLIRNITFFTAYCLGLIGTLSKKWNKKNE